MSVFLIKEFSAKLQPRHLISFAIVLSIVITAALGQSTHAAPVTGFNAGRIIDDSVFINANALNINQIQSFLNSKVPVCDTNGTQASEYGGGTRAQWGAANYGQSTFTCLRDYSEGGKGAAQIIYEASQDFQINPQVLLVLLQKEQGLVTDTWPLNIQYRSATGYGCPDTAPCDSQYYGLTNQVRWSARMFRAIMNNSSTWYTPYLLGDNFIQYSPNASCGGSTVTIQNRSTQALYNYTPYQPNAGALAAGWGQATCGAYGNRNFYLYFTEWFGNTIGPDTAWMVSSVQLFLDAGQTQIVPMKDGVYFINPGQKVYLSISGRNIGRTSWGSDNALIGTNKPFDYTSQFKNNEWISNNRVARANEPLITPNSAVTFTSSITAPSQPGDYTEYYGLVIEGVTWVNTASITLPFTVVTERTIAPSDSLSMLQSGQSLRKGDSIISTDKNSVLRFQENGNVELFVNFKKVWETKTQDATADRFINQGDGNLVLYNMANAALWSSGTQQVTPTTLKLQPDGNLVLYSNSNIPLWSAATATSIQTHIITQIIRPGDVAYAGQSITTPNRRYVLTLQGDGNLVLYDNTTPLWNSMTIGPNKASYLTMQADGNLVLYTMQGRAVWNAATFGHPGSTLNIQGDGNLVVYANGHIPIWQTRTFK